MGKPAAFPWFKVYLINLVDDLQDLDMQAEGAYFRALRFLWSNGPATKAELQRRLKGAFVRIEHLFSVCETEPEPLLSIRWLNEQREGAEQGREKWRKAGEASAEARRAKSKKKNKRSTGAEHSNDVRSTNDEQTLNERSTDVERSISSLLPHSENGSGKERAPEPIPFELFWEAYERKGSKKLAEEVWDRMKPKDQAACMARVEAYKRSKPDKLYRRDGERFLRHRTWEDEIIEPTAPNSGAPPKPMDRNAPIQSKFFKPLERA